MWPDLSSLFIDELKGGILEAFLSLFTRLSQLPIVCLCVWVHMQVCCLKNGCLCASCDGRR